MSHVGFSTSITAKLNYLPQLLLSSLQSQFCKHTFLESAETFVKRQPKKLPITRHLRNTPECILIPLLQFFFWHALGVWNGQSFLGHGRHVTRCFISGEIMQDANPNNLHSVNKSYLFNYIHCFAYSAIRYSMKACIVETLVLKDYEVGKYPHIHWTWQYHDRRESFTEKEYL